MPAPTPISIATGSVTRLLKEESTYHKELADGEAQLKKLEDQLRNGGADEDGNADFLVRQQKIAVEQTKAVFKHLRERIDQAVARLGELVEAEEKCGTPAAQLEDAKTALDRGRAALSQSE